MIQNGERESCCSFEEYRTDGESKSLNKKIPDVLLKEILSYLGKNNVAFSQLNYYCYRWSKISKYNSIISFAEFARELEIKSKFERLGMDLKIRHDKDIGYLGYSRNFRADIAELKFRKFGIEWGIKFEDENFINLIRKMGMSPYGVRYESFIYGLQILSDENKAFSDNFRKIP